MKENNTVGVEYNPAVRSISEDEEDLGRKMDGNDFNELRKR